MRFPRSRPMRGPGQWWPAARKIFYACPDCGVASWISPETHAIANDGGVFPELVCPADGCSWHAGVMLEDWP